MDISDILTLRLIEGKWLDINGEAIYKSKPWRVQKDTLTGNIWYTVGNNGDLYASLLSWPEDNIARLGSVEPTQDTRVFLLGNSEEIKVSVDNN